MTNRDCEIWRNNEQENAQVKLAFSDNSIIGGDVNEAEKDGHKRVEKLNEDSVLMMKIQLVVVPNLELGTGTTALALEVEKNVLWHSANLNETNKPD